MKVEARAAQPLRHGDRLLGRAQKLVGTLGLDQLAPHIAGHRGEGGAGADQGVDVVLRPVPDLDLEAEPADPPDPLHDRQVAEEHLGTGGKGEHRCLQRVVAMAGRGQGADRPGQEPLLGQRGALA